MSNIFHMLTPSPPHLSVFLSLFFAFFLSFSFLSFSPSPLFLPSHLCFCSVQFHPQTHSDVSQILIFLSASPPNSFSGPPGRAVVAFKLLSRDTRGRVETRQLLVPEQVLTLSLLLKLLTLLLRFCWHWI